MKHTFLVGLFILAASSAQAASFDCEKASSRMEKAICADSVVSDLDGQLFQAYKNALASSADGDTLKSEQRSWLANVRNKCDDAACMRTAYTERIAKLGGSTTTSGSTSEAPAPSAVPTPSVAPLQAQELSAGASTQSSIVPPKASLPAPQAAAPKNEAATDRAPRIVEKPDAGIAGIFNGVYTFLVALLLVGLVKPKWILLWDAKANRKKLVGYFFVVAVPFGILGEVTKSSTTRSYDAKIRADKAAERAAEAAKQKAMEEEQSARRAAQAESVQAARRETSRPRALWERYYAAINANGTMCEQYKFVIKNWHESGFDENVLNQQAAGVFAQAREAGCVQ